MAGWRLLLWPLWVCGASSGDLGARVLSVTVSGAARGGAVSVSCRTAWSGTVNVSCDTAEGRAGKGGWTNYHSPGVGETWAGLGHEDGVVMTVMHQVTGSVLLTRTFNTWHAYTHGHDLKWWVEKVEAGRVVVLSVRRAGTYGLGAAIPTLTYLGSLLAPYAPPLALWVWVYVAGGRTLLESLTPNPYPLHLSLAALYTHTFTQVAHTMPMPTGSAPSLVQLCNSHAALGRLCDPMQSLVLPSVGPARGIEESLVGVVVCAGGRLQYLAHTLRQLLQASHVLPERILVAVGTAADSGEADPNVVALLNFLQLNYQVVDMPRVALSLNHRLFQYYRNVWALGVKAFPHARYLTFLDEDVEVSGDWLSLLLHLAPALEEDSTLWCVSGTSAAHMAVRPDPSLVTRGARQPGWGFLVLAKDARAAVATWPDTSSISLLYDTFLYHTLGRSRECLYPVLSRARHYGVGVNTLPEVHHFYFLERPLHDGSSSQLPAPSALTWHRFEARVWSKLAAAVPLTTNPCAPGFIPVPASRHSHDFVFYFFLDNMKSSLEWTVLAECVGAWPYSTQGLHQGCVELPQAWGGSLWLVGVPASPYHTLKPPHIPVWRPTEQESFKQEQFFSSSWRPRPNLTNKTLNAATTHLFIPINVQ